MSIPVLVQFEIRRCGDCTHLHHTGGFDREQFDFCGHRDMAPIKPVSAIHHEKRGREVNREQSPPDHCPLRNGSEYQ